MVERPVFLDFEKPIADLEKKIEELNATAEKSGATSVRTEVSKLRQKANRALADLYQNLDPWRRTQVVRERSAKPLCGGSNPPDASKALAARLPRQEKPQYADTIFWLLTS